MHGYVFYNGRYLRVGSELQVLKILPVSISAPRGCTICFCKNSPSHKVRKVSECKTITENSSLLSFTKGMWIVRSGTCCESNRRGTTSGQIISTHGEQNVKSYSLRKHLPIR